MNRRSFIGSLILVTASLRGFTPSLRHSPREENEVRAAMREAVRVLDAAAALEPRFLVLSRAACVRFGLDPSNLPSHVYLPEQCV